MKKGFTLLELLIAFLISILVIVSVYNILNSTINYSASSKQESEKINMKYNLTRLITDDITSVTDNNILKSSSFGNTTVSFSTLNTLVLNKMISIKVTYLYEKNILYRIEENEETGLYEKFKLAENVKNFDVLAFDNDRYVEEFDKIGILKFKVVTENDDIEIVAGNLNR
ncbi:MAG: hypothetical protein JG767_1774 [Deferribacteraceae bacterium]|jgi:type II secretory pathway pseudopilin PulG|nr:hypothetical protein [Deferribacteraceae bacterium]